MSKLNQFDMAFLFFWVVPFFFLFFYWWMVSGSLEYGSICALLGFVVVSIFIYAVFGIEEENNKVGVDDNEKLLSEV